jgi:hypothetical protein
MRTIFIAWCLALVLTPAGLTSVDAQTWNEVRPKGGRYRVLMPGPPVFSTEPVVIANGRTVHVMQAAFETSTVAYLSRYTDFSLDDLLGQDADTTLGIVRDGSAEGHLLRSDRQRTVAGYPAREYVIEQASGVVIVTRAVLVGNRLYQIIVAGYAGVESHPDTSRFLDSFALDI